MFPEGIDQNCIKSLSIDGVIYGVPLDVGGYGFYYNINQLEAVGVSAAGASEAGASAAGASSPLPQPVSTASDRI